MDPINPLAGNPEAVNPNVMQSSPPKDPHGITIAAMAVFVLLALGAVAFLYYQNQQLKGLIASYQTPQSSSIPTPTPDVTANWKTYINSSEGFSFKYPTEVNLTIGTKDLSFKDSSGNFQTTISWNLMSTNSTLEEELTTRDQCPKEVTDGLVPGPIPGSLRCDFAKSHYTSVDIWILNRTKIYKAEISAFNPNEPIPQVQIELLNQILSTFQFISSATSPTATPKVSTSSGIPNMTY